MQNAFKQNFGDRVAAIIVCFEVFVNRLSTPTVRTITWSNSKHHNTIRFLICITPQEVVFLSKLWVGRVHDTYFTEHSGLLKRLLPGGLILKKELGHIRLPSRYLLLLMVKSSSLPVK